jgi:heme/copper-type cytochrome/quinol oxidase subunit 2
VENALISFFKISSIYLPVIITFCLFLYRVKRTSNNKTSKKIEYEQGIVTLIGVFLYNFFLIVFICYILFIADVDESGNPFNSKLTVDEYLDFALLFVNAPLAITVTVLFALLLSDN